MSSPRFRPFDRVRLPIDAGLSWPGVVRRRTDAEFCGALEVADACPVGGDRCPGPWYDVIGIDPSGTSYDAGAFAEHELEADTDPASGHPGAGALATT